MKTTMIERRNAWRALPSQDKQQRLKQLRDKHQKQVEFEMLRLQTVR
jgi:hypothetical protein